MARWLLDHGIELVGAVASIIAAVAAVWLIRVQRRLPDPQFGVRIDRIADQPGWHEVFLSIVLPPDQRFLLKKLSVVSPAGALLLLRDQAWQDDGAGNLSVIGPLAREKSAAEVSFDKWMGPTGHREPHQTTLRSIFFFIENAETVNSVALKVTMLRQLPMPKDYAPTLHVSKVGAEPPTIWL